MAYTKLTCYTNQYPTGIPESSNKQSDSVDIYNAKVGMKVIKGIDWIYKNQNDSEIGTIIQISGEYDGKELHSHQCVVKWDKAINLYRIGYANRFDLAIGYGNDNVTIYNAYVGAPVIRKNAFGAKGKIIRIIPKIKNCVVEFDNVQYNESIGHNNEYDLIFNLKTKKDGRKKRNNKDSQSIKVQRFNSKIREGNRERGFVIQRRASRAKCEGFNIQNEENIIKSKKISKLIT